ncbi:ABC transporter ATP-binding protein [Phaeobacter italicus]|jgi:branched-chain amino acid transport system ATP-binding protein|uniref:ABC transporter ATP-binding protein n=1 Tax=Phaeobacter italicus TaxID=481446 RepID=UPI002FDA95CA
MIRTENLESGYGEVIALNDISFEAKDQIFAVLGSNGAGKSTLLKALAGLLPTIGGKIHFNDTDISGIAGYRLPSMGISYVPQEANVFPKLSVIENLRIGGRTGARPFSEKLDEVYDIFPKLKERSRQLAGSLSGGEGQMLAVGRALMQEPAVLLLDEPSAGLSPLFVDILFQAIVTARERTGMTVILAEQNAVKSLEVADRVMVLSLGTVHLINDRASIDITEITDAYHI